MSDTMERRGGGLGPNQLRWLRENIASFSEAEAAVKASDENAARIRAELEGKKRRKAS